MKQRRKRRILIVLFFSKVKKVLELKFHNFLSGKLHLNFFIYKKKNYYQKPQNKNHDFFIIFFVRTVEFHFFSFQTCEWHVNQQKLRTFWDRVVFKKNGTW